MIDEQTCEGLDCAWCGVLDCPAINPEICDRYYYPETEQEYNELMEKIRK